MDDLVSAAAATLADHPKMGRPGLVQGTRELFPHENYRLVYEIDGQTLWMLALVHTARQWPKIRVCSNTRSQKKRHTRQSPFLAEQGKAK
jgi:hypothetical protein